MAIVRRERLFLSRTAGQDKRPVQGRRRALPMMEGRGSPGRAGQGAAGAGLPVGLSPQRSQLTLGRRSSQPTKTQITQVQAAPA